MLGGSAITVDLSTGSSVLLTAEENQDYLVGLYTISANDSGLLGPLDVTAMSLTAADASVDEILDFTTTSLRILLCQLPTYQTARKSLSIISQ